MKRNKNQQLMEQREQSQVYLSSAESRQKKAKGQYVQANKDWLAAKSREDGVKALPKGISITKSTAHSAYVASNHYLCSNN